MKTNSQIEFPKSNELILIGARPGNLPFYYNAFLMQHFAENHPVNIITTQTNQKYWDKYLYKVFPEMNTQNIHLSLFDFKTISSLKEEITNLRSTTIFIDFYHNNELLKRYGGKKVLEALSEMISQFSATVIVTSFLNENFNSGLCPRPEIRQFTYFDIHSVLKYVTKTKLLFRPKYYRQEEEYPQMLKDGYNLEIISYSHRKFPDFSEFMKVDIQYISKCTR